MQQPPCKPRPSIRRLRGRISAVVAVFILALIAAFLHFEPDAFEGDRTIFSSVMPGQLSGAHSNFALADKGCVACHEAHGKGILAWAEAFVTANSPGENCVDCHAFGGGSASPHNMTFQTAGVTLPAGADVRTDCVMCHTEHKGQDADIAPMKDAQCNSCHETKITAFGRDHPAFGERFPHDRRPSIAFDHVAHFGKHFPEKLAAGETRTCVDCHDVGKAALTVPPGSFEANCASCHLTGITDRTLRIASVPFLEEDPFADTDLASICPPTADLKAYLLAKARGEDAEAPEADEYFFEDNGDNLPPALALALGVAADDPDGYIDAIGAFYKAIAEDGSDALAERIEGMPGAPGAAALLAGLDGELVRQAVCAWMQKVEYEAPGDVAGGGWSSDGMSINYRPVGHADPVARAWFDFAVNAEAAAKDAGGDDTVVAQAAALRDVLLSEYGLGNCTKCHAVTQVTDASTGDGQDKQKLMVEWGYQAVKDRPYVHYDHGPHVNLLGPGTLCSTCHKENAQANFSASFKQFDATKFEPGFLPVKQETCTECHTPGKVRQDCLLCHEYHLEPHFNRSMGFQSAGRVEAGGKEGG
ncbi:MAG: hypothetical protein VYB54_01590 [Pseudomonadota bacterium]|nr:hypothetical protein [Pseudomonadota bacterium]